MKPIYQTSQIQAIEQYAIKIDGISELELMNRAAKAAFNCIQQHYPHANNITIFCGAGNNAGDGYTLATILKANNKPVEIKHLFLPEQLTNSAKLSFQQAKKENIKIDAFDENEKIETDVIVDCILGTGITRAVSGIFYSAIEKINKSHIPVIAIDIPSGLCANTGSVLGIAIKATYTITFIGLKLGLVTAAGPEYAGIIESNDLKIKKATYSQFQSAAKTLHYLDLKTKLIKRKKNAHKGDFGHVLIIGGDFGMPGAPILAAIAALKTGAGLVTIATRPRHITGVVANHPEIMAHGVENGEQLEQLMAKATVIVCGPGLGQNPWSKNLFDTAIQTHLPLVLDADALNLLSKNPSKKQHWILTPHPGEAARLLNTTVYEIQADRLAALKKLSEKYSEHIVLKGAGTLIFTEQNYFLSLHGNPGMSTAGMGDVLTGTIASLIAQKFPTAEAIKLGVSIHSYAADLESQAGTRGLLATDLFKHYKDLLNP